MDRRGRGAFLAALIAALAALGADPVMAQPPAGTGEPPDAPATSGDAAATESMSQATTSEADMNDDRARGAFRLGRQYYEQGRFGDAASEFERAYGLSGRGQLLFNAYLAYRDAQDSENAIRTLRGYLSQVADIPDRAHLEARLAALEQQVATQRDRQAQAEAESSAARLEAEEARRRLEEERTRPETVRPWWPWAIVGGGVVLVGAGIALGSVAATDASNLRNDCPNGLCNPVADLEERRSSAQTLAGAGDALWISGALVAGAGLVLAFVLPDEIVEPQVLPSAACWGDGCAVSLGGSF